MADGFSRGGHEPVEHSSPPPLKRWATLPYVTPTGDSHRFVAYDTEIRSGAGHVGTAGTGLAAGARRCREPMGMKCTHVALQVRNIEQSIAFYEKYCGMRVVHDRTDAFRVVWMGWGEQPPKFVIVLLESPYELNRQPPYQHLGIAVAHRDDVDAVHARAVSDGITPLWPPADGGLVVGYFCGVADPDGNMVEFSYGQKVG